VAGVCAVGLLSSTHPSRAAEPGAGGRRTSAQIVADMEDVMKQTPNFNMKVQLDPRAGRQMNRDVAPYLNRLLGLIAEFEKVDKVHAPALRWDKCLTLVRLALWQNDDALKALTDASNSPDTPDAVMGKAGLLMLQWCGNADAQTQAKVVTEFTTLAKANVKDDLLASAALRMADAHASSLEIGNAMRDVVEKDLTGPVAMKYRHQAFKVGRPFKVTVRTIDGKTVSTANWKGKVVVVDFWATWCPPCVATVPKLAHLYEEGHPKGLEILGISNDQSQAALKEFLANHKEMAWPESFSPAGPSGWHALASQADIHGIPTTFIVDRNGVLAQTNTGFLDEAAINALLDQPATPATTVDATPAADPAPTDAAPKAGSPAQPAAAPATPAAPSAQSPDPGEKQAESLLTMANNYLAIKRPDKAAEKLNQVIEKYPNTKAAAKAREMLPQVK
jgi:thiol-disulfide isomerase/thioredoxin